MEVVAYTEVTNDDETTSYYNAIFTFSNNLFAIFHKVQLFDNNWQQECNKLSCVFCVLVLQILGLCIAHEQ